ncbi:MAG: vitamin B12-dependent ribonucleotide reductase [Planctomycetota bacterium]
MAAEPFKNAKKAKDGLGNAPSEGAAEGLRIDPFFATPGVHPFDQVEWERRSARIGDSAGKTVFEQKDVEVPATWSQLATNVAVSKYFYGEPGKKERENSVRDLIERVTRTITDMGKADGVFATDEDAERFYQELTYLCVNQYGAFNSPVWFNVGLFHRNGVPGSEGNYHWDAKENGPAKTLRGYEYPQGSACFIQAVEDSMEDIMRLAAAEAMLFKYGSGSGTDLSTLRSSREKLAGGGTPSGPLSFMRVFDQIAGVVKSGGKTRRAAKMQSLRVDHPDIKEFIECKMVEEKKAWTLIDAGYDGSLNGDAYSSVMYQNANLSIRVTDEFMQAAEDNADWQTYEVTTGNPSVKYKAKDLLGLMAESTHLCGDPGVQYHTTINRWHTCKASGEICASNPCSEYMFLNDSACNLASVNLLKFRQADGQFDVASYRAAARIFIIAQDILVDHSSYPTQRICRNSHDYRPLGIGYANLGALLMSLGLPYDGDAGRAIAAALTGILTGTAYTASAELASRLGAFSQFQKNRRPMLDVMRMHRQAVDSIATEHVPAELLAAAAAAWDQAIAVGEQFGYRNAQVSVLAPTGTIGFMMDCDTTGIEPDIALVKYKQLVGGGMLKIVNRTVPMALARLGYDEKAVAAIIDHIDKHDTIEGAPGLKDEHLAVFDCAFKPANGNRCIHYMGHIRMMGAVQPFISGAISKTVNMPKDASPEEIRRVYVEGWKLGVKAIAVYRDGSKRTQPLNVTKKKDDGAAPAKEKDKDPISREQWEKAMRMPHRRRLPATRPAITHKFDIAGHEGYINVGLYDDGRPGELFITMAKEGSIVGGMMDAFATAISLCLQYGVPLEALIKKFSHQKFDPSGITTNKEIPFAKSIVDYIFRWLDLEFNEEKRKSRSLSRGASASPETGASFSNAAPEAVTDDKVSEPGRADQASGKDAQRPGGAPGGPRASGNAAPKQLGLLEQADGQMTQFQEDAPPCPNCGRITVRNGSCYKCYNCGESLGCS